MAGKLLKSAICLLQAILRLLEACNHSIECLGKFAHKIYLLAEITLGDHLGLPCQMAQTGLQGLEAARYHSFHFHRLRKVASGH